MRRSFLSLYLSFPFSPFLCLSIYLSVYEPPRSRVAAVFAADTALQLRPRVASFASFLLVSCVLSPPRVHSRLLRGTRLSLTSNPKATHRRVPRETLSAPTRYILIGHVGFIDRSPSTSAQQARRRLMAERYARLGSSISKLSPRRVFKASRILSHRILCSCVNLQLLMSHY